MDPRIIKKWHLTVLLVIAALSAFLLVSVRCDDEYDENESENKKHVCNGSETIDVKTSSGKLSVNNVTHANIACIWTIDIKDSKFFLTFPVIALSLSANDEFVISMDNKVIFNASNQDQLMDTIIFTGIKKGNVTVKLTTSSINDTNREFNVDFGYVANNYNLLVTNKNQEGFFSLPVYNFSSPTSSGVTVDFELIMNLQSPLRENYKLVVEFNEMTIGSVVEISGTQGADGKYSLNTPDLIAGDDNKIKISLKNFKLNEKNGGKFRLHYSLYYKGCTRFDERKDFNEAVYYTPKQLDHNSMKCLYIILFKDGNFLSHYNQLNFVNNMDSFTFRSGNRRNSSVLAVVNNQNKWNLQNSYRNTISMGESLYISYDCPFGLPTSYLLSTIVITPFKDGGFFTQPTTIKMKEEKNLSPIIFILKGDEKHKATFSNNGKQTLKVGKLEMFDTDEIDGRVPFATFKEGNVLPDTIVSPSNTIRLEFSNLTNFEAILNTTNSTLNSVASLNTGSLVIAGDEVKCSQTKTWLIPQSLQETIFSLQIPFIFLNSSDDKLVLSQYNTTKTDVFIMTGKSGSGLNSKVLPEMLMFATSSYLLSFTRGSKNCDPKYRSLLLQASYALNYINDFETPINLTRGESVSIESEGYPNYYPLRENKLNNYCLFQNRGCGWFINPAKNGTLFVTVIDIDLAAGNTLLFNKINITSNKPLPPDTIFDKLLLQMNVPIKAELNIGETLSGRGFLVNVTEFDYGAELYYPKVNKLQFTSPPAKRCIWTVQVAGQTNKTLNFTVNFTKKGTPGNLTIVDSPTMRDFRVLKLNKSTEYQPASVDHVIIIYEVEDVAKAAGLNITWKSDDCLNYCKNGHRCILSSWICNNVSECGDWSDEINCNQTSGCPRPPDVPTQTKSGGVNGWVIVFVIIPLAMVVGAVIAKFGPTFLRRMRGSHYQEFRDFSEVS